MEEREELVQELMATFSWAQLRRLQQSPAQGLRQGERAVLFCLQLANGPMRTTEIAARLEVVPPAITPVINRLEKKGYLSRQADQNDRRAVTISLTQEGEKVLDREQEHLKKTLDGLLSYLGEEDSRHMLRLTKRIFEYYLENKEDHRC